MLTIALCVLGGCGKEAPPPATSNSSPQTILLRMKVVDLDGNPLGDMRPIVSATPNAFEPPLAMGEPTGADGLGSLSVAAPDSWLYARAWDPRLRWFSNVYFSIPADAGNETPQMEVVMARGAGLDALIAAPDGAPAANKTLDIMMAHPTKGPWWPAKTQMGPDGAAHFDSLPPGTYTITFMIEGMGKVDVPNVELPPGGHADIGAISVR